MNIPAHFVCFKRFARVARSKTPGSYMIQLLEENKGRHTKKIQSIFQELDSAISVLEQKRVTDEWQPFDLFQYEFSYGWRRELHHKLLLLETLGVLKYISDPYLGIGMHVTFQHPYAPREQLVIDLSSLRLKEQYETSKLKLMEEYATQLSDGQRAEAFNEYFYGKQPLLVLALDDTQTVLTEQQQELLKQDNGIHIVEGPAGSGKTTLLVEYIKHLIHFKHVQSERILIMTHYRSATTRIAGIAETFQKEGSELQIKTINNFGEMIFRKHRSLLLRGDKKSYYENDPSVLNPKKDEWKEQQVVNKALVIVSSSNWRHPLWPEGLEVPQTTKHYQSNDNTETECLGSIRRFREYGLFPANTTTKEQITNAAPKLKTDNALLSLHYAVYLEFLQLLGQGKQYTFDDQILFALAILRSQPRLAEEYQNFYEYVIVDELQDFTRAQAELLLLLSQKQKNLLAFGDRDQGDSGEKASRGRYPCDIQSLH